MTMFTGTLRLLQLALRRDRIKLPLWIIGIITLVALTVPALEQTYGSPQARATYAATMSTSLIGRAYGGIMDGTSLGAITMIELYLFTAVVIAFMSTTLVIRHTRQNEEMGSAELIGAARVGRAASLSAALSLAALVNIGIGLTSGVILSSFDALPPEGGWGLGAVFAAVGICFAAIAAVAAQLSGSSRGANSIAGAVIGLAFLARGVGDAYGRVEGATVVSLWPSWLSPLGWGQQIHPFTQQRWWIFLLFIALTLVSLVAAYLILARRDAGSGVLPARKGPTRASRQLRSPLGLAWRLQRSTLLWWAFSFAILGLIIGGMTKEFESLLTSSDFIEAYIAALGGEGALIDAFLGGMIGFMALAALAYVNQALLKVRAEEAAGHLESILGTATSRRHWLLSHVFLAALGTVTVMCAAGFFTGLSYILATGDPTDNIPALVGAALAYVPALLVMGGLIITCIGIAPRAAASVAWLSFIGLFFLNQLGALLKLPEWVEKVSPFSHVPVAPSEAITVRPLLLLSLVAFSLFIIGFTTFRRRNLITE